MSSDRNVPIAVVVVIVVVVLSVNISQCRLLLHNNWANLKQNLAQIIFRKKKFYFCFK